MTADERSGFLQRWSRRKAEAREAGVRDDELPDQPLPEAADAAVPAPAGETPEPAEPPPPTLDDVRALTPESDFAPFVARRVAPEVKNAALKKLFSDPHYNVMDGLDTYIDDYSKLEPLPAPLLRRLVSARTLALFDDEVDPPAAAGPSAAAAAPGAPEPSASDPAAMPDAAGPAPLPGPSPTGPEADVADPAMPSAAPADRRN